LQVLEWVSWDQMAEQEGLVKECSETSTQVVARVVWN
jgi:hypothetical protein